jgi:starch-binding outer membrane protein, SusD/RagB family
MKKFIYIGLMATVLLPINACNTFKTEETIDPNLAGVSSVSANATKAQLDALAVGQMAIARDGLATYLQVVGTFGKELLHFNSTESRWMTELTGLRGLSNSVFYNVATTAFGLPIRHANIIIASLGATNTVNDAQKNGYRGLANTFKGYAMLMQLNAQYNNGIRLDISDPYNPSKFASYTESLAGISTVLDQGAQQLDQAGASFPFSLPTTYEGFNTPATFKRFNRAIALRVAIYQKDWPKAASLLPQTFYNASGSMTVGVYHSFNPSAPDVGNPLVNTSTQRIVAVQRLFDDIETGDTRRSKVIELAAPISYSAAGATSSSKYLTAINNLTATTPVPIIRNEELVLIAAEIAAQQANATEAVRLINLVRSAARLGPYTGPTTQDALINAILKERLYSLFYEGHRWIDMRRYGKLAELVQPTAGMRTYEQMLRPLAEVNWDIFKP